jgi:alkanesulfonate monooxygenase SsuD/methylene tetrahydromethanopterin reductase-like flavin-dependent oxidoreductase (luciferase family)
MTERSIRCGVVLPGGTAPEQLELAVLAERSGWDGVFAWEAAYGVDAWSLLAAMAVRTSRVRLGTMLTPLPWRRPWKVASQVATVDQLSSGRAILAVGTGATETDLPDTGEVTDLRGRAALLDEGIDLIRALWSGERSYQGAHYRYRTGRLDLGGVVQPVQDRLPIWVVGVWPAAKSMRRTLRCDGVIPQFRDEPATYGAQVDGPDGDGAQTESAGGAAGRGPAQIVAIRAWLAEHGARDGFDVIADGETPAGDKAVAAATVAPWAEAGCTWWLETRWGDSDDLAERIITIRERIAAGPPSGAKAV